MKKLGIIVLTLALLVVGMAMADPGIPKVNEVQGLSTSTTVIAAGNFNAASSVDLTYRRSYPSQVFLEKTGETRRHPDWPPYTRRSILKTPRTAR